MRSLTLKPAGQRHFLIAAALAVLMFLGLTLLALPAQAASSGVLQATNTTPGGAPTLSGNGFTPGERVDLWLTSPSGMAVGSGYAYADNTGAFSDYVAKSTVNTSDSAAMVQAEELALPGQWYVTARGVTSDTYATTNFQVISATLSAAFSTLYNGQAIITFNGANFYPGENVSLWITDSAGTVIPLNYMEADQTGQIPAMDPNYTGTTPQNILSFTATTGGYYLTAHGNTSGQTIYTKVVGS